MCSALTQPLRKPATCHPAVCPMSAHLPTHRGPLSAHMRDHGHGMDLRVCGDVCVLRATWNSVSHTGVARGYQLMHLRVWRAHDDPRRACSSRAAARAPVTASAVGAVSERLDGSNSAAASSSLRRALQLSLSARLSCSAIMRFRQAAPSAQPTQGCQAVAGGAWGSRGGRGAGTPAWEKG